MDLIVSFFIFALGLCFGSFINMLVYRTAVNYELRSKLKVDNDKYSFCDYCGRQLRWCENIPVISWVIQMGRTRCCGKKLPLTYPIVELLTGLLFLGQYYFSGNNLSVELSLALLTIVFLVFSGVFDFYHMILPDFSTVILFLLAVAANLVNGSILNSPVGFLVSTIGAALFLGLLNLVTKGKGMGWGDVKLAFFMGVLLGWPKIIVAFYGAFISGAVVGIALMIKGKASKKSLVPFGPFLLFGTLVSWWFGEIVLDLFRQWIG